MKDPSFLDFFFSRIRWATQRDQSLLLDKDIVKDYPFVSPCGVERNYVRPADLPIVFHTLHLDTLVFGATLKQPFSPSQLALSPLTGRLYHGLVADTKLTPLHKHPTELQFGLVRSSVAVVLSEHMEPAGDEENGDHSEMIFVDSDQTRHSIMKLPHYAEPGSWAMPSL
mmetsp:Transcript_15882/g.36496  ORF Transcript_15882/g.36496 Transcript_15882/m.36496 type:complete len:169 (-) Transcript_15882:2047-2553(-)